MAQNSTYPKKHENILYSQEFKLNISESVGVEWRTLGRRLNIGDNYLEIIDQDNSKTVDKAYSMLTTWTQMKGNLTLEDLKTALRNMRRVDLIRKIDEFAETSNSPVSSTKFSAKKETSNSPVSSTKFSAKKDISEICTALKRFYLTNYGKICEFNHH
ncbi:uncharacterized protein LOC136076644 [Hydra vulgaris]|uniref:Uncharacterized protein LOC136076644 n=1 Tax=Hydra vulgaris TaxID=6087 RepID=A0ABM4BAR8_HYDVU